MHRRNDSKQQCKSGNVAYLPIYMVAFLKQEVLGEVIYDVDLEGIDEG